MIRCNRFLKWLAFLKKKIYVEMLPKKKKKHEGVEGYEWNVELKRIVCDLYIDITLKMSIFSFFISSRIEPKY